MSKTTQIEWATSTGSPWIGCTKVSAGCKHCYAETMDDQRFSRTMGGGTKDKPVSHWGKGAPRVRTKAFWTDAAKWNRQAEVLSPYPKTRPRIFPSLCDWLDDEVPIEWLADFLKLIHDTPNLDWLLLTKRPENWNRRTDAVYCHWLGGIPDWQSQNSIDLRNWISEWIIGNAPKNVWVGVSVEDQQQADRRIPLLLQIPAEIRLLSVEPLLGPVNLHGALCRYANQDHPEHRYGSNCEPSEKLDWVIIGGESGKDRRDCGVEAICDVARQCLAAGVPTFVKQDCAFKPGQQGRIPHDIWGLKNFPI